MKKHHLWLLLPFISFTALLFIPFLTDIFFKSGLINGSLLVWVSIIMLSGFNIILYKLTPTPINVGFWQAYKTNLVSLRLVVLGWFGILLLVFGQPAYYILFAIVAYLGYCALDTFLSSYADRNETAYTIYGILCFIVFMPLPNILEYFGLYQNYQIQDLVFAIIASLVLIAVSYFGYQRIASLESKRVLIAKKTNKEHLNIIKMEVS